MIIPSAAGPPLSRRAAPPPLVGREREQEILRDRLAAACASSGGLVLIGGEAGVGKTVLAEALCAEARQRGALVLVGHCYDLTETPPYGPWTEACSPLPPSPRNPAGSNPPLSFALHSRAQNSQQFFTEVRAFFVVTAV